VQEAVLIALFDKAFVLLVLSFEEEKKEKKSLKREG